MGKKWDYDVPSIDVWREALRVLKPGAHALVACGTRTQHRMAAGLEDAGFEIRDVIAWLYGSGFPKSLDVSKAIDKAVGAEREVVGVNPRAAKQTPKVDSTRLGAFAGTPPGLTAPATPDAARWQGYGTALKPAMELWTLVRRPLEGTVARNALEHGVGGINVDGCRVGTEQVASHRTAFMAYGGDNARPWHDRHEPSTVLNTGRWPANVTHDGSREVLERFPDNVPGRIGNTTHASGTNAIYGAFKAPEPGVGDPGEPDFGSAARFFYCAKADGAERDAGLAHLPEVDRPATWGDLGAVDGNPRKPATGHTQRVRNVHPTVKPLALTAWLATLIRPPERDTPRRLLVPFAGSGSEMIGARLAGWDHVVGIEREAEYAAIARARILHHTNGRLW
jgi:hypothetical protein